MHNRQLLVRLVGLSFAWFTMDFAFYGNTVSTPLVLGAVMPQADLIHKALVQLYIFAVAAMPGYSVAALTMDRVGRKSVQVVGFLMMAVCFAAMALFPGRLSVVRRRELRATLIPARLIERAVTLQLRVSR